MKLLDDTIASVPIARPIPTDERPQGLCLDRGYDYDTTRESVIAQRFSPHIRARGEDTAWAVTRPRVEAAAVGR